MPLSGLDMRTASTRWTSNGVGVPLLSQKSHLSAEDCLSSIEICPHEQAPNSGFEYFGPVLPHLQCIYCGPDAVAKLGHAASFSLGC